MAYPDGIQWKTLEEMNPHIRFTLGQSISLSCRCDGFLSYSALVESPKSEEEALDAMLSWLDAHDGCDPRVIARKAATRHDSC